MRATLRLFKAVPIAMKGYGIEPDPKIMAKTLKYGFVFDPQVFGNYNTQEMNQLADLAIKELGLSGLQMNTSFHKSWEKVRNAPIMQLVMEQLIHYWTTYGFEALGVYDNDSVYIPAERLDVPDFKEGGFNIVVIRGIEFSELKDKLLTFLASGIALKQSTVDDVLDVAKFLALNEEEVEGIKNREVKVALYDHLGLIPRNAVEFLRFVIYKVTGKTLLIKDRATIAHLKAAAGSTLTGLFNQYEKKYGIVKLAEVFYRFKPIFLALRKDEFMRRMVNRIRKLADKFHVPMNEDYFNTITAQVQNGTLDLSTFEMKLKDLNMFRKVRLANTLSYRCNEGNSPILYKIRNGKGYAKEVEFRNIGLADRALETIIKSIGDDLSFLNGKRVFIPENVVYSMPATEKQFSGMFPSGSYVKVKNNLVVGVYWENLKNKGGYDNGRVDLDLSMREMDLKIGWDGRYRTEETLFSGDMTDATNGASELFYVKGGEAGRAYLLMLNYFNPFPEAVVPFKMITASEKISKDKFQGYRQNLRKNDRTPYMVDPNNMVSMTGSEIRADSRQKVLGLVETREDGVRFYFSEFDAGNSITNGYRAYNEHARKYLVKYHSSLVKFEDVLNAAGAIVSNDPDFLKEEDVIDLSPAKLEKDTFTNLLTGNI